MEALQWLEILVAKLVEQAKQVTFLEITKKAKRNAGSPDLRVQAPKVIDPKADKMFTNDVNEAHSHQLNDNMQQKWPTQTTKRPQWMMDYANNVLNTDSRKVLKCQQLLNDPQYWVVWSTSSANEFRQLAQGIGNRMKGMDTIYFVHKQQLPWDWMKDVNCINLRANWNQTRRKYIECVYEYVQIKLINIWIGANKTHQYSTRGH